MAENPASKAKTDAIEQQLDYFCDIPLRLGVDLGQTKMTIRQILELEQDGVIELPKSAGDNMEIKVKGVKLALGEIFVIEGSMGVRITEIVSDEDED